MPTHGLKQVLAARLDEMAQCGRLKSREIAICGIIPARDGQGPRYLIEGEGDFRHNPTCRRCCTLLLADFVAKVFLHC